MKFHLLNIIRISQEVKDCKTFHFALPEELKEVYHFIPGQYVTIKCILSGKEERRSYSISSLPQAESLSITVKAVESGYVSNWMNKTLSVGDSLEISEPEGRFIIHPDHNLRRQHVFFAAGSGITPMISMIKQLLEIEPKSSVCLFYGSRTEDLIIFKSHIDDLQKQYEGQFFVEHILSRAGGSLLKKFGFGKKNWGGKSGRITMHLNELLDKYLQKHIKAEYYLCGPGSMIEDLCKQLEQRGVKDEHIHKEYYTTKTDQQSPITTGQMVQCTAHINLNGVVHVVEIPKGKKILETLLSKKLDPPYSCSSGACATCMAKLQSGSVIMDISHGLDQADIDNGYILTCQARPTSEEIRVEY